MAMAVFVTVIYLTDFRLVQNRKAAEDGIDDGSNSNDNTDHH
jgi:hypothetical protein